ncbi:MAG: hypothetical protein JNL90_00710 [Planctomycetes bacterium]|nr:hypothetical protein [Planctomycetota bacterium]
MKGAATGGATSRGEARLATRWRIVPLLIALLAAALELSCLGGLYFPDTTAYLGHTFASRLALRWPTFNPAYPLLLDALIVALPAAARMAVLVVLQQACVAAIPWLTLRCGELLGRPRVGFVAALLTALHAPLSLFAQTAMSDSLFAFLVAASSYWFVRALAARRASGGGDASGASGGGSAWLAGALAVGAVAQRSSGVALLAAAVVALLLSRPRAHAPLLLRYLAGAALMLAAVLAKNFVDYGRVTLVEGRGIHLFCRVAARERAFPPTPEVERLEALARRNGHESLAFPQAGWRLHALLIEQERLDPDSADALLETAALQALRVDPRRSFALTIDSMVQNVAREDAASYTIRSVWERAEWERFEARTERLWAGYLDRVELGRRLLPPYPPRAAADDARVRLLQLWSRHARAWCGGWLLLALLACGAIGLWRRDPALLFCAGLPFAQVAASAIGEIPFAGHFDPVVPATWLALLLASARWVERLHCRSEGARRTDAENSGPSS